jgi:hypothetical protein
VLQFLIILFTLLSVCSAVLFSYYSLPKNQPAGNTDDTNLSNQSEQLKVLSKLNLILPLIATVLRGIYAALNPATKASLLKLGSIKVESEIYKYRTKVGPYSIRKVTTGVAAPTNKGKRNKGGDKDAEKDIDKSKVVAGNPRKAFSAALDSMWTDLSASDINKGKILTGVIFIILLIFT